MYSDAIRKSIHPATWAVIGVKNELVGQRVGHRGTAFAIDQEGHLLTAWHVLFTDQDCTVEWDSFIVVQPEIDLNVRVPATVVTKDKVTDLAILKIERTTAPVTLENPDRVPYGSSCALFGHPISLAGGNGLRIFTRAAAGVVSMPFSDPRWPDSPPIRLYELDFFSHGGSSGGPVFLRSGNVFGVISGSRLLPDDAGKFTRSNLSLAIDIREAVELAHRFDIKPKLRRSISR